jgi:hypothetical protein
MRKGGFEMKRLLNLIPIFVFLLVISFALYTTNTYTNPAVEILAKGILSSHEAKFKIVEGFTNPDVYGVSGHGPALNYTDNSNGSFTYDKIGLILEEKDNSDGIHHNDNTYSWSATIPNLDGSLFADFLDALKSTCDGVGETPYEDDISCGSGVIFEIVSYRRQSIPKVSEWKA